MARGGAGLDGICLSRAWASGPYERRGVPFEGGRALADVLTGAVEPGRSHATRHPRPMPRTSRSSTPKHAGSSTTPGGGQRKLDRDGNPAAFPLACAFLCFSRARMLWLAGSRLAQVGFRRIELDARGRDDNNYRSSDAHDLSARQRNHQVEHTLRTMQACESGNPTPGTREWNSPSGERIPGPRIVPTGKRSRTNDGACDPAGRFLIGTLALDDRANQETLVRVEDNVQLTSIDADLCLSNGLAWSPDVRLFYNTDTVGGIIWVRGYDPETGLLGERREHLRITNGFRRNLHRFPGTPVDHRMGFR